MHNAFDEERYVSMIIIGDALQESNSFVIIGTK